MGLWILVLLGLVAGSSVPQVITYPLSTTTGRMMMKWVEIIGNLEVIHF